MLKNIFAVLAGLMLLLAGCTGDEVGPPTDPGTSAAPTVSSPPPNQPSSNNQKNDYDYLKGNTESDYF